VIRAWSDRGYGTPASPGYILPKTPPASAPPPLPQSQFVATTGAYRRPPRRSSSTSAARGLGTDQGDLPPLGRLPSSSVAVPASLPSSLRRVAPSASQPEVMDVGTPSPSKKAKPSAAGVGKATTDSRGKVVASKKKAGPASKSAGQAETKKLTVLTVGALTKAFQEAARTAASLAARLCSDVGGASSAPVAALTQRDSHETIMKMVLEALHPVVVEVVESAEDVERLRADHSRLSKKAEVEGVSHEMTAKAVVQLRDQAPEGVKTEAVDKPSIAIDPNEPPIDVEALAEANKNYREMAIVRTELRKVLEHEMEHTV